MGDEFEKDSLTKTLKGSGIGHILHDGPIEPRCETPPDYIDSQENLPDPLDSLDQELR